jgi:Ca2+-binding RTX toxin-like protein
VAKHEQNTDLVETWNIETSNKIWVLGKNASIEVGDNVGEQYGIYVADGMTGNRIDVKGGVTATAPLSDAAIGLIGDRNTLHVFESSTLTATNGVYSTSYGARIQNEGTIDASLNGIYAQAAEELFNSGDIFGETGIHSVNGDRITNSGKIDATVVGILTEGTVGTITNRKGGEIIGDDTGISIDADASRIVNFGKIIGGSYSLTDHDGEMTVINRGTIEGNILMYGGNDTFDTRGGTFNSIIAGGLGDDVYKTSSSTLKIMEASSAGIDEVMSTVSFELGNNLDDLTLLGKGNTKGRGNELENELAGNRGDNRLFGGAGADRLYGGAGKDVLRGDEGDDVFVFRKNSDTDIVDDFSTGDKLVIDLIESYELDDLFANHLEEKGEDLVITYGDDKLVIKNTNLNELTEADFAFV